jgi:hypothetical protein
VDRAVEKGRARSRNELGAAALRRELAAQREAEIDAAFEEMARDEEYLAEAAQIEAEFAAASWEALQITETDS